MLQTLRSIFTAKAGVQNPYAHCIIDVQRRYCDPSHKSGRGNEITAETAAHIARVAPLFRDAGIPTFMIFYAQFWLQSSAWASGGFYQVKPQEGDTLVRKFFNSAFANTSLRRKLEKQRAKTLILSGVNLNACVLETALDTVDKGFEVCVLQDCVANDNLNNRTEYTRAAYNDFETKGIFMNTHDKVLADIRAGRPLTGYVPSIWD